MTRTAMHGFVLQRFSRGVACAAFWASVLHAAAAVAQRGVAPAIDRRFQPPSETSKLGDERSDWRGSTFSWNNSATTQTLGVGDDVQSEDPTYEMSFALAPRYYVWEDPGKLPRTVSVAARIEAIREFTNSDTTTERGEWLLSNLLLAPQYSHAFYESRGYSTTLAFRAPAVALPTSKASRKNGTYFGLGGSLLATQDFPLLGADSALLSGLAVTGLAGYEHAFRRATTPTNPELERERMGPDGETLSSDQLTGRAFIDDEVRLGFSTTLNLHERVRWSSLFEWHLAWKYRFEDNSSVALPTGTAPVDGQEKPDNFGVVALFATEVAVLLADECSLELGYQNLSSQLGPDAQRRAMFYSPEARFSLSVVAHLDAIAGLVTGGGNARRAATASSTRSSH
jgi:hypothetical protein